MTPSDSVQWGIDWLSLSSKYEGVPSMLGIREARALARRALTDLGAGMGDIQISPIAFPFYRYTFEEHETKLRVSVSSAPSKQGVLVVGSGAAAPAIADILRRKEANPFPRWRATRIDIAIDLKDEEVDASAMYEHLAAIAEYGKRRTISIIRSDRGLTIYLGSRSSDFMLRIYDKAKEQKIDGHWWRFEAECKGALARDIWYHLPRPPYPIGHILEPYEKAFPVQVQHLLGDMRNGVGGWKLPPREQTSTELWFSSQVIPAFGKLCRKNPQQARLFLETMIGMYKENESKRPFEED